MPYFGEGVIKEYCGFNIKMNSDRYINFKKNGIVCRHCKIKGSFFALERHDPDKTYHFNLYAVDKHGNEVLMTKDHIIPKSRGGKNHISNYQVLCTDCNNAKGNLLPGEHVNKRNNNTQIHLHNAPKKSKRYNTSIEVGDIVCKVSRKPFKTGKRIAKVIYHTVMWIPYSNASAQKGSGRLVDGVYLKDINKPVTTKTVHRDKFEIALLAERDRRNAISMKS